MSGPVEVEQRYALRTFRVDRRRGVLLPIAEPDQWRRERWLLEAWQYGVCVAQCPHELSHQPPVADCCCGTYGSLSLSALVADCGDLAENIVAVVSMEGPRIIVADGEVRASAARVVAYWCNPDPGLDAARAVLAEQCSAATVFADRAMMVSAYGLDEVGDVDAVFGSDAPGEATVVGVRPGESEVWAASWTGRCQRGLWRARALAATYGWNRMGSIAADVVRDLVALVLIPGLFAYALATLGTEVVASRWDGAAPLSADWVAHAEQIGSGGTATTAALLAGAYGLHVAMYLVVTVAGAASTLLAMTGLLLVLATLFRAACAGPVSLGHALVGTAYRTAEPLAKAAVFVSVYALVAHFALLHLGPVAVFVVVALAGRFGVDYYGASVGEAIDAGVGAVVRRLNSAQSVSREEGVRSW